MIKWKKRQCFKHGVWRKRSRQNRKAIQSAIDRCLERGILTDILKTERRKVASIILTEYDEKMHLLHTFEEGREVGIAEGMEKGIEKGRDEKLLELIQKKRSKGKNLEVIAQELEEESDTILRLLKNGERK